VPEPLLHDLQRQFEAAVLPAVDAPRGVKVGQRVERVFRLALAVHDLGRDLRRLEAAMQDIGVMLRLALISRKNEVALHPHPMFAQRVRDHRGEGDCALASL